MAAKWMLETPLDWLTPKEVSQALRSLGKVVRSRIKTMTKAYGEGGAFYGRKSYFLDRWGDIDVGYRGKTDSARLLLLQQMREIIGLRSSTVKGLKEIEKERFQSFRRNHGELGGIAGKRRLAMDDWRRMAKILGRIQAAEKDTKHNSNEQVALAWKLAENKDFDIDTSNYETEKESIDAYLKKLQKSGAYTHSSDFFLDLTREEQAAFQPVNNE